MDKKQMRDALIEAILCNSNIECDDEDTALFDGVEKIEPFESGLKVLFESNELVLRIMEG